MENIVSDIRKKTFHKELLQIALPVTFQSLCQSSFSLIDQIMIGQLGNVSIAGVGLGGKFSSLFTVTVAAVATTAGILISQYYGKQEKKGINDSFIANIYIAVLIAILFTIPSLLASRQIMGLYSNDPSTIEAAATYIWIIGIGFVPMAITLLISTLLRSIGYAVYPMYVSFGAVVLDTVLNYTMIFGKLGFPKMGIKGAALSTTIAKFVEVIFILIFFAIVIKKQGITISFKTKFVAGLKKKIFIILYPVLICEFLWCFGENIYATVYGRIGTDACAAMTLTNPIQSLLIGAFSGIATASGIMVGKRLGKNSYDEAYDIAKVLTRYGLIGTIILGGVIALCGKYYVLIFNVSDDIRLTTVYILYAYAIIVSIKVQNMILGGGVLRSGGITKYSLVIDMIGTWVFGIPCALISAYVFKLPIYYVYFILSLEEVVRYIIEIYIFRSKKWMRNVT